MNDIKTTVILGGGVGGVVTATTLRKKLDASHRIVIVDRQTDHVFAPSFLWLMTGDRTTAKISRPLSRLAKKGIEVIVGEIEHIDPANRRIRVASAGPSGTQDLAADYLVVSLGAELAPDAVPGLEEAGHNLYTLSGVEGLHTALTDFSEGRIVVLTATPAYKCPAAPYEAAMLLDAHCRKRQIRDRTQLTLHAAEPGPLGVAGPDVSAGVRQMVEEKGIEYHPEHQVIEVDIERRRILFADDSAAGGPAANGRSADFDLLVYVPPHRAPRVIRETELVDESGWISVDKNSLSTRFPHVYAIGDVTVIPLAMGKPLPKAGVFAERQAKVVAHNIAREITGKGEPARFNGHGECFIETGDGKAGFGHGNFYAEPTPRIKLHGVGRHWHVGKVLFEKTWFRRWL